MHRFYHNSVIHLPVTISQMYHNDRKKNVTHSRTYDERSIRSASDSILQSLPYIKLNHFFIIDDDRNSEKKIIPTAQYNHAYIEMKEYEWMQNFSNNKKTLENSIKRFVSSHWQKKRYDRRQTVFYFPLLCSF